MYFFIDCITKKYFTFKGRARRKEFWFFLLFYTLFAIACSLIDIFALNISSDKGCGIIFSLYSLAMLIPSIAVTVRRFHDTNRTGWWYLIILVPILSIIGLVFTLLKGTSGDNRFGPDSLA